METQATQSRLDPAALAEKEKERRLAVANGDIQSHASHRAGLSHADGAGEANRRAQFGQRVEALSNHCTVETLDAALAQFDVRANPDGVVKLFIEHETLGEEHGDDAGKMQPAAAGVEDKGEGDPDHDFHPAILAAMKQYGLSATVAALVPEGAEVWFQRDTSKRR